MRFNILKQDTLQRRGLIINGSIPKTILLLSLPTLMMSLVQAIIPFIDALFINNVAGMIATDAVQLSGCVLGIIMGLAQGLGSAGMALIGQANGRGDLKEGRRISTQLVVFASLFGVALAPVLYAVAYPISAAANPEIANDVFLYLTLNTFVIPFAFLESIYNAIKNASGKPEATFIRMVIMLVLKVLFNGLFIVVLRWGITGAVMASLASNLIITVWMYVELFVKKSSDRLTLSGFKFDRQIIRSIVKIGLPSMLANMMMFAGFLFINFEVQKYGTAVINGQAIANNVSFICFTIPAAFAAAVTTMVSMNIGASNNERAKAACWWGCLISAISGIVITALAVPFSNDLSMMFSRDTQVLSVANTALNIYTYSVAAFGVGMVQLGAFTGLGRTRIMLVSSVLRIWLLRYLFILATQSLLGVDSVFWGVLFSNCVSMVITTLLIIKVKWVSVIRGKEVPVLEAGAEGFGG